MSVFISLIAQLAASSPIAVESPDLILGLRKTELSRSLEGRGAALACSEAEASDPPGLAAEVCGAKGDGNALVVLFSRDSAGASRVIATSHVYPGDRLADLRQALEQKLGKPSQQSTTQWGESLIWQQGPRQISLRAGCSPDHLCVEASQDANARRLARSSGMFVPAQPGY